MVSSLKEKLESLAKNEMARAVYLDTPFFVCF